MTNTNILDQYQFYNIITLLHISLKLYKQLHLPLKSLFLTKPEYEGFIDKFKTIVIKIADDGLNIEQLAGESLNEEIEAIWDDCRIQCK
jgi:hypothetical protein